jgi:hypothetical protein
MKMGANQTIVLAILAVVTVLVQNTASCTNSCTNFNPNKCLNTITGTVGSSSTFGTFSTSGVNDVKQLDCGSRDTGMNDLVSQFDVSVNGVYEVSTINLSSGGDTTLQINKCSGKSVDCNDDLSSTVGLLFKI